MVIYDLCDVIPHFNQTIWRTFVIRRPLLVLRSFSNNGKWKHPLPLSIEILFKEITPFLRCPWSLQWNWRLTEREENWNSPIIPDFFFHTVEEMVEKKEENFTERLATFVKTEPLLPRVFYFSWYCQFSFFLLLKVFVKLY